MTAEEAYDAVVAAIKAIDVSAITDASEREGPFTHDDGSPSKPQLGERIFRLDVASYDPAAEGQMRGCHNRHLRAMLRILYAETRGYQQRALRDVDPVITALRGANGGELNVHFEGSTFDHESIAGWLAVTRAIHLHHRGT